MILTKYSEKDYSGRFNLKTAEKKLIIRALHKTKDVAKLAKILRLPEVEVLVAIIRHQIVISSLPPLRQSHIDLSAQ